MLKFPNLIFKFDKFYETLFFLCQILYGNRFCVYHLSIKWHTYTRHIPIIVLLKIQF